MTRAEAWFVHSGVLIVGGTGLVYGWMRYFATPTEEFAIVNHPWQPEVHAAHILVALLLVFACGLVWRDHVWRRVRRGYPARRGTGLVLFATFFPMAVSGYLIQTAVEQDWRLAWTWVHGVGSVVWLAAYLVHQLSPRPEGAP
jgi:hypothetical protein